MYVELHTSSAFSFLEAASFLKRWSTQAARFGYSAIALLDRDGVYGAPRFHRAAIAAGIKPIIGAELTIALTRRTPFALSASTVALSALGSPAHLTSSGPGRIRRGLSQSVPARHAHEDARAERRRRADV